MHTLVKHLTKIICNTLFLTFLLFGNSFSYAEQSVEEIIKTRQSILSKNYKVAKKVNSLALSEDFLLSKALLEINKGRLKPEKFRCDILKGTQL